jgi:hypothetical protein
MKKVNFEKIKNFKLNLLQNRYKYLSGTILKLEKHIDILFNNNIIDYLHRNHILSNVFSLSKKINSAYNNYILENLDEEDYLYNKIKELIILFPDNIQDNFLFDKIAQVIQENDMPMNVEYNEIKNIIKDCGFENLIEYDIVDDLKLGLIIRDHFPEIYKNIDCCPLAKVTYGDYTEESVFIRNKSSNRLNDVNNMSRIVNHFINHSHVTIIIGSSDQNIKTINVNDKFINDNFVVNKTNWISPVTYNDVFEITINNGICTCRRIDSGEGWGMNLIIHGKI